MSRSSSLARVLRDLKQQRDEVLEKKQTYDHDCKRAVSALAKFTEVVEKANAPDLRRQQDSFKEESEKPPPHKDKEDLFEDEKDDEKSTAPSWAKKAYRLIAFQAHPDRVNLRDDLDDYQRDRLLSLYREATESYESGNYSTIAEIAAELEINAGIPEGELEKGLENRILTVREEISSSQKTLSWAWGTSFGDTQKRIRVLKKCCEIMSIASPDESALTEIIKELESKPDFDIIDKLGRVRRIKSGVERRKTGERPVKRIR
jgi:hypothetical protein